MIPYGKHHIDDEDIQAVVDVLRSGVLTQGPAVEAFENAVAEYVGVKFAVAVSSGTAALHLAALAAGVGPGTTLATSPITFVASANAGLYTGGGVVFADIDPITVNMSPDSLHKTLEENSNVRAVVPVHFAGLPCDMPAIKLVADTFGVAVIEDAAHALGATYLDGRRVGSCAYSQMTIFSFHPVKAIAAGEGGMITTNDELLYRKLLRLRSHGINKLDDPWLLPNQAFTGELLNPWYYEMQELGYHYRICDIQCGLALSQFAKLDMFIARRRAIAEKYDAAFKGFRNCRPAQIDVMNSSGRHLYVLRIDFDALSISRAKFMQLLRARGIGCQVHYIPVVAHPFYQRRGYSIEDYPQTLNYYKQCLSIPLFYDLTDEQQAQVIDVLTELIW